ncbi:MAG: hypothetical protein HC772_12030 [Leptolyngbyaceae cyanobacterium CRU_2_3]|nr:hypothetical protein [Leptolyngbyaceae cyanobacterium CRU_2_3]
MTHSAPQPTETQKVQQLESLLQHEVWSHEGNQIGKIADCLFNLQTGVITDYLFVSSGWTGAIGEIYQLPPTEITNVGKKRVLVRESATTSFNVYCEGIPQKLTKAKESLQQEATEEFRSLTQRAEAMAEQAKARLQSLTEQAKEQAQSLSQKAKEKAQALNEQMNDQLQDAKTETRTLADQAKERSRTLAEQVKERSQVMGKQLEEGFQTLTVQAEEIFESVAEDFSESKSKPPVRNADQTKAAKMPPTVVGEDDDDEPWI